MMIEEENRFCNYDEWNSIYDWWAEDIQRPLDSDPRQARDQIVLANDVKDGDYLYIIKSEKEEIIEIGSE